MDSKIEHTYQEEVYSAPQKKGGRVANCCRKFWWAICLVIIVIVLVVLLPIIFVGIPNKAQHDINASTLEVKHQDTLNPTSDSIHLRLDNVIKSGSQFHPDIDAFQASLSLKGQKPFLVVDVPATKSAREVAVTVEQDLKIPDLDRFTQYTKTVLASETFDVYMDGKTTLHLGGLPSMKVNYNKVVKMKGLNKLAGLSITDLKVLMQKEDLLPDGSNLLGIAHVNNPSVMTLDLGNITMNLAIDGSPIGTSLMPNVVLKPGPNSFPIQSITNQATVLSLVTTKYKNGVLPVDITGNSSVRNGQELKYYSAALQSNPIRLDLDVKDAINKASNATIIS